MKNNQMWIYYLLQIIRIIMFLKWIKYALHEEDAE